ncbi:hypothetical protein [Helicobacter sp. MIT 14-3879]|uniref:hypothetical protein n=1 Tax=Helicobacter sp. MIT 14-3879 TaxID=2040649 RepID=UPI000E1EF0A2|nr:hypothetical protein [Helicobacter sp. MIT 14-3879]RDU62622.1 hypothetical protein CQA44_06455 [Helicobacter sp. MIT 14-3879]
MKKLDSWDILVMFFKYWKLFVVCFGMVLVIGFILFFKSLQMQNNTSEKMFKIDIIIKTIKNIPIINEDILNKVLEDEKIIKIQNNIFEIDFEAENLDAANIYADNIKSSLTNNILIKEIISNIANLDKESNNLLKHSNIVINDILTLAEIKNAKNNFFIFSDVKELKSNPINFVQTSKRSKIILIFLSAFIVSCIFIYIVDFIKVNRDKLSL